MKCLRYEELPPFPLPLLLFLPPLLHLLHLHSAVSSSLSLRERDIQRRKLTKLYLLPNTSTKPW